MEAVSDAVVFSILYFGCNIIVITTAECALNPLKVHVATTQSGKYSFTILICADGKTSHILPLMCFQVGFNPMRVLRKRNKALRIIRKLLKKGALRWTSVSNNFDLVLIIKKHHTYSNSTCKMP